MVSRKIFFLIPLILLSALILFAAGFFLFFTLAEYRPANLETARIDRGAKRTEIKTETSFKVLIWNIGYCGLDAQNDFFYDGGTGVTARSKEAVLQNAETVKKNIAEENCEFNLLQETDIKSKRSFYINEKEIMENLFTDDDSSFAVNYNAVTVPYPVLNPLGKVHSGIFTASKFKMQSALRRQLPGSFSWPFKTVNLKRCLFVSEFETEIPGKNLYIINLHLSAYDSDGSMRRQEMAYLKDLAESLYKAGHWVIAGGDWNSIFPGVEKDLFTPYTTGEEFLFWIQYTQADFIGKDWQWVFDKSHPTVRTLEKPYKPGENYTTIIDGFLVSPNVEVLNVHAKNLHFEASDHNPIIAEFRLMPPAASAQSSGTVPHE